ncbi:hypothetical protein OIU77_016604 [Salix suchowensis]|uniref:BHLH domain-containing protein n=1 Tax=Salix suchowensis TaxID=1278906 RepID=A0ABQ8ZKW9_9ROSI|nr:hypothetical protein OIU77_016604 [Salix suchowensis]
MAGTERFFEGNHLVPEGNPPSFSELLLSNDGDSVGAGVAHAFHFSSIEKSPTMLCFGGYTCQKESDIVMFSEETKTTRQPQISGVTCSDSSSASSCNNNCNSVHVISTVSKSNRKRNGSGEEVPMECTNALAKTPFPSQRNSKRTETKNPGSTGNAKVKREKLGDRIAALQELVSPFGKTDTASVLHEAMGYIRFLQDQVKVLCSPYLQNLPQCQGGGENGGDESVKNLRSRGLCLVSVDCTLPVTNSNGADFWSPAAMEN